MAEYHEQDRFSGDDLTKTVLQLLQATALFQFTVTQFLPFFLLMYIL